MVTTTYPIDLTNIFAAGWASVAIPPQRHRLHQRVRRQALGGPHLISYHRSNVPQYKHHQSSFTNFQTGLGMDAADDLIASVLAGGSVTPLV